MIDNYSFGQIVIRGQNYKSDVLIFPDRVDADWWRVKGHELAVEDIATVLADPPEVLVVGTGRYGRMAVLPETERTLASRGVQLVSQTTKEACQSYNDLLSVGRHVVAALHLTC